MHIVDKMTMVCMMSGIPQSPWNVGMHDTQTQHISETFIVEIPSWTCVDGCKSM